MAWYLKSQGYTANGSHPCRDWFYNRLTVNPNLGLDDYLFTDNYYYQFIQEGGGRGLRRRVLPPIWRRGSPSTLPPTRPPLFSFNVTYQGHGPYDTDRVWGGGDYCTGDYQQTTLNALNNYFLHIENTSDWVEQFADYLDTLDEPVVLLLYGDPQALDGQQWLHVRRAGHQLGHHHRGGVSKLLLHLVPHLGQPGRQGPAGGGLPGPRAGPVPPAS